MMFNLLPRGAYPNAGLLLIEALRDYEQMLEQQPARENPYYRFQRNRAEFSWHQLLSEFCLDPLTSLCLHPRNWTKRRPDLYVSIHITERDNFVIEVRPTLDTGFRYGGTTFHRGNGDFCDFPVFTSGWDRPTNRVLYVNLGALGSSFHANEPWVNHVYPGAQHAAERHLLMLVTRAKLHQLSLYFNCYLSRELVEFGPEHYIDFRGASGEGDSKHRWKQHDSMETYRYFDPNGWASPTVRERLAKTSLAVPTLYQFATAYLDTLDVTDQAQAYAEYLGTRMSRPVTQSDVDELLKCATNEAYREEGLLADLAVDSTFAQRIKTHNMFNSFCRNFGFTEQAGLAWIGRHQPAALVDIGYVSVGSLIAYLHTLDRTLDSAALVGVDKLLAVRLAADDSFRWAGAASRSGVLDAEAHGYGFPSFEAFQLWAKDLVPLAWAASVERAERLTAHVAACEAEAQSKREVANAKRRATLAAKKTAKAAEKTS